MKTFITIFLLSLSFSAFTSPSHIELQWDHFTSSSYGGAQLSNYKSLEINYNFDRHWRNIYFNSHFAGQYFLDSSKMIYYSAPEMYFSYSYVFNTKYLDIKSIGVAIGRKINSWSISDEYWEFGLWNPLNRWDFLHPISKGLIGTFVNIESKNWSIDMLVGGLYLPSSYAKVELKDNLIFSYSRWFLGVPNKVDVLGRGLLDIEYLIKIPFLLDIFSQQSYILNFKTWLNEERTFWTKWSYGYKPINDLFIVTNTSRVLEIKDMQISKEITAIPVKHTIISSEWGGKHKDISAVLSMGHTFVQEGEEELEGLEDWDFLHERGHFTYFSLLTKYNISSKNYLQLSFLKSFFSKKNDKEDAYQDIKKTPFFFNQYKILNGIGFDLHVEYLGSNRLKRQLDVNYKYSPYNKGGLLFMKATYYMSPKLYTSVTINVLGAKSIETKSFLYKFRANDYFGWRLGYVF